MPDDNQEEQFEFLFQFLSGERKETAPSRLKSRTYTALIRAQRESGPLQALTASEAAGRKLCLFERLVRIAPLGEKAKTPFFCAACQARILAERVEDALISWENCPYVSFQRR
jgi:hypothetical protein